MQRKNNCLYFPIPENHDKSIARKIYGEILIKYKIKHENNFESTIHIKPKNEDKEMLNILQALNGVHVLAYYSTHSICIKYMMKKEEVKSETGNCSLNN